MSTGEPSFEEKFRILAKDYQKLKQHNAVLKKAVLEEQGKTNGFEQQLEAKAREIKNVQEQCEELSFHNKRLTVRLNQVLQEKGKKEKKESSGSWFARGDKNQELEIAQQELAAKIEENERLVMDKFEIRREFENSITSLETEVGELKNQLAATTSRYQEEERKGSLLGEEKNQEIEKLSELLQKTRQTLYKEEEEHKVRLRELTLSHAKLEQKLETISRAYKLKNILDDTEKEHYHILNVPPPDRSASEPLQRAVETLIPTLTQLFDGWVQFNNIWVDRWRLVVTVLSEESESVKLTTAYMAYAETLPDFHMELSAFLALLTGTVAEMGAENPENPENSAPTPLAILVERFHRILKLHKLTAEAFQGVLTTESTLAQTGPALQARNALLIAASNQLSLTLSQLPTPLRALESGLSLAGVEDVVGVFAAIQTSLLSLHSHVRSKIALEQRQNSRMMTASFRDAGDAILTASQNLTEFLGELKKGAMRLTEILCRPTEFPLRGREVPMGSTPACVAVLQSAGRKALATINAHYLGEMEGVPYEEAIGLREKLMTSSALNERLAVRLAQNQKLLQEAEAQIGALKQRLANNDRAYSRLQSSVITLTKRAGNEEGSPDSASALEVGLEPLSDEEEATSPDILSFNGATPSAPQPPLPAVTLEPDEEFDHTPPRASMEPSPTPLKGTGPAVTTQTTSCAECGIRVTVSAPHAQPFTSKSLPFPWDSTELLQLAEEEYNANITEYSRKLAQADADLSSCRLDADRVRAQAAAAKSAVAAVTDEKNALEKELQSTVCDLDTTRATYEEQIATMSEHIMAMTDQLSQKDVEVSHLRAARVKCGHCKTWNSVDWLIKQGNNGQRCINGSHPSGYNFA